MSTELSSLGAATGYGQLGTMPGAAPGVTPAAPTNNDTQNANPVADGAKDFAQIFNQADEAVAALSRGEGSAQAVVEAMAQAELALQTAVTIRDRVVEAYQEILRMPV